MTANYSSATRTYEYQPTIIESRVLISRLALQIAFVKNDPAGFLRQTAHDLVSTRHALLAFVVTALTMLLLLLGTNGSSDETQSASTDEQAHEVTLLDLKTGSGRVGFNNDKGEGSGATPKRAQGGGSGGNRNPVPPQTGKLPPPSPIPAAIPIAPPVTPPALPVAGIDIDPALWKDVKAPVYGDPRSTSEIPSKGPGEGEGIGTNRGTGIGDGRGPGVGPGEDGNTGGGPRQIGCCGPGGSTRDTFTGSQVDQRARLLSKPEPQYTEEARRNQISGTVMLRAVFSSAGEVVRIRALNTLPFGLTERAIAAARQIRFVPAMKSGRAVSVYMQLEYNFNLY